MKIRLRRLLSRRKNDVVVNSKHDAEKTSIEPNADLTHRKPFFFALKLLSKRKSDGDGMRSGIGKDKNDSKNTKGEIVSRTSMEKFAYSRISTYLPKFTGYKEVYEQAGIPRIFESYLSSAFLISVLVFVPVFVVSLLLEILVLRSQFAVAVLGSIILGAMGFATSFGLWLFYPVKRRNNFKTQLENQMAYSFGVLGVLAAAGMTVDRLFEGISLSESNPVLAGLARRFLRNVRVFGMDIEAALREVATHSPSIPFSRMLESVSVAFKTTGSLHNLIMFESSRLFTEKREKLRKSVSSLAIMAELYITLIVVGPIIFIVMLTIFLFLPSGGAQSLPDPALLINIMIFIGIPTISAMFVLMLDSMVAKV